jgi:hypothetical protein
MSCRLRVSVLVLTLAACGAPSTMDGGDEPTDAAVTHPDGGGSDAGVHDAGSVDAGSGDAGAADAGMTDAGVDAGATDAGFDAGTTDAGFDAGTTDAGVDAGATDAGFDAGTMTVDAGAGCTPGTFTNPVGDFTASWVVCPPNITVTVTATTTGWAAIGFNSMPQMPGADIALGWVKGGSGSLGDLAATVYAQPSFDVQQNLMLLSATEVNGVTTFTFIRPLNTLDSAQDVVLGPTPLYLLWAMNPSDPVGSAFSKHVSKGVAGPFVFAP